MSIGIDMKEVLAEIGISVLNRRTLDSGEFIDYEPNAQVTKPFIREFFLEGALSYDTEQIVGDIINFTVLDRDYILMSLTPESLENEPYLYGGVYYRCNVSGEIQRPSGEADWDEDYRKTTLFEPVETNVYALQTEPLFGTDLDTQSQIGDIVIESDELYIPSSYGIKVKDRYQSSSGEYYIVDTVLKRRFSGVDVCKVSEDTR